MVERAEPETNQAAAIDPILLQVLSEQGQAPPTRKPLLLKLEAMLGRPVVSFFTSFLFPVNIEHKDADILENVLQAMDLSHGLALLINSPGGLGVAAERIINICRSYSKTGEFWAIVPGRAKSAATMICFGASKIIMGVSSELGPVDPQYIVSDEKGQRKSYSVHNIVRSYEDLFKRATTEKGNLQPYIQQLANYHSWDIEEFKSLCALSSNIAVRALISGMMHDKTEEEIKKKISLFLTPEKVKVHERPIYSPEASDCGLKIESVNVNKELWKTIYELYMRTDNYVSTRATKCIESKDHAFAAFIGRET